MFKIEMVNRWRTQVVHSGGGGAVTPTIKQSFAGIDDAQPLGRDLRITKQTCGNVHPMNAATDDKPLQTHDASSLGPSESARAPVVFTSAAPDPPEFPAWVALKLSSREFMVSAGLGVSRSWLIS